MSKRAIELIKTIIIVMLTISGMFLAWRTGLFNDVLIAFPMLRDVAGMMRPTGGVTDYGGFTPEEAARPLSIVITNEEGERFGIRYDTDMRNTVFERASGIVGEALGSAAMPVEITKEQWRDALSRANVYFEYILPVRLSILDGWFGLRKPETVDDIVIRRIFVSFDENRNRLYYQDYYTGKYFSADTASTATKAQELETLSSNGAVFAFETNVVGSDNAPYMILMPGSHHPDVRRTLVHSQEEMFEVALSAFGHSHEVYPPFLSGDTLVCVGSQFSIWVHPDGRVIYRWTSDLPNEDDARVLSDGEMIEHARIIVANSISLTSGDAYVQFEAFIYDEGMYMIFFGYYVAGGRVHLHDDRHAARVSFSSGVIVESELNFRNFTLTGEEVRLLPEKQVLAASGGEFMLSYSDTGSEVLHPSWVRVGSW